MSLVPIPITDQLEWLPLWPEDIIPSTVRLPLDYEAYLKVLPPLGIDRSVPIASYSFATRTISDLNARAAFWDKYGIRNGYPEPAHLERTTYREIADTLGLPYDAALDSSAVSHFYGGWPPHLGSSTAFEESFVQQLIQTLGATTDAYFHGSIEEGTYHWDEEGFPTDWLELGLVGDLLELYQRDGRLPTYLFAVDHTWCLYQGEWVDWIAIGCSRSMALTLSENPYLEALPLPSPRKL